MPGYLTHLMILSETDECLAEIIQRLGSDPAGSEIKKLAADARNYLRQDPQSPQANPAVLVPVAIDNQVGNGISKYAYAGSLGPDIPAASYILAINQRWVRDTMHKGSPRRAWANAGTTSFVLQFIDAINRKNPQPNKKSPMMAYVIGHLSSIATHVLVHPFILHLKWDQNLKHTETEVAFDAVIATGYFKRSNMFSGQSWESYYLDKGDYEDEIKRLMETYLECFESTYKSPEPLETLCGLPPLSELEQQHPGINSIPGLKQALNPYPGFDRIERDYGKQLEAHGDLRSLLKKYEGTNAKLDVDFLIDGYRNTVNWAIDEGYDESPVWWRLIWYPVLVGGAALTWVMVWGASQDFGPTAAFLFGDDGIFNIDATEFENIRDDRRLAWQENGFTSEYIQFEAFSQSYGVAGYMFIPFSVLMTGPGIGIFRQGTKTYPARIVFTIFKTVLLGVTLWIIGQAVPKALHPWQVRWFVHLFKVGMDVLDVLVSKKGDRDKGIENDQLSFELYKLQLYVAATYFISCLMTIGAKAGQTSGGVRESTFHIRDFGLMCALPLVLFPAFIFHDPLSWLDSNLIENVASVRWPSTDTKSVDSILMTPASGGLADATTNPIKVRLFPDSNLLSEGDRKHYPEAEASTPFLERDQADDQTRKQKSEPARTLNIGLTKLFDRAKYFSSLLAMAAVRYDQAAAADKERVKKIFKDWNLDFRSESEWNELMQTEGQPKGILEVMDAWLSSSMGMPDIPRLKEFLALAPITHSGQIEDRSVVPNFPGDDASRIFVKDGTPYSIKDRNGNVVFSGTFLPDGRFEASLQPGEYELTIEHFEGLKT